MSRFDAWYLPNFRPAARHPVPGSVADALEAPVLSPEDVAAIALRTRAAGEALRALSNDDVIRAIDTVARRFLDPADPLRLLALHWLPRVTGYSDAMCTVVLDRMAGDWTWAALRRLLRAELRDPRVLERFVRHAPGQRVRAVPPRLALHVLAGNVPGVGVTSIVRSLLVRAPALCKTARGEPVLPVLFARALAEAEPALAHAVAVTWWEGGSQPLEQAALRHADIVVHYGGTDAVNDLRRRLPDGVRLVEHGPRIAFALISRERAPRMATAREAARAVSLFDQQGCVSPHLFYVEEGGRRAPVDFAAQLATALHELEAELPRGRIGTAEAGRIQQLRADAEFRALAGEDVRLWLGERLAFTVVYDADPSFTASCLNRTVWVKPVPRLEMVPDLVRPHAGLLQTVALDAPRLRADTLAPLLAMAGASRITSLAAMPWPPPSWHHDGRGPLRELLRFSDLENS